MVCAAKGYPLVITMADSFSIERRRLMRFLGAKVVLTPRAEKGIGMYRKAQALAEKNGWFFARQFESSANADIHESTTGQEIVADFADIGLDYWVTGYGTGGTVSGVARVLRRELPECKIILSEPHNARLGRVRAKPRHATLTTHPRAVTPHGNPMLFRVGRQTSFPRYCRKASTTMALIRFYPSMATSACNGRHAWQRKREYSLAFPVALHSPRLSKWQRARPRESVILAMLPDTGERYLSTPLFETIPAEMSDEEQALADSV